MPQNNTQPILTLKKLNKIYKYGKRLLHALHNIDLQIVPGETLGLAGESGCGKSTLGKLALGLEKPTSGSVAFCGSDLSALTTSEVQQLRRQMQMIFQDPYASLNPRMTIEDSIGEGLDIHRVGTSEERQRKIRDILPQIGMEASILQRYPHEFSGGQRQRISIARALILNPAFLVCDEPLSALDACTQKQILQLLLDLKQRLKLTYLFISHDLHAMHALADTIAVMYLGHIVEKAPTQQLFSTPLHPYTKALLAAIPIPDPILERKRMRIILKGDPPSPLDPPGGCPFHTRCPVAMPLCSVTPPPLIQVGDGRQVACHAVTC